MNIYGEGEASGLSNPLTENLIANGFRITDMADPVAGQDAVTLEYYESNMPSQIIPYDWMVAYSDETSQLGTALTPLPVTYQISRDFTPTEVLGFLTNATTSGVSFAILKNGTSVGQVDFLGGAVQNATSSLAGGTTFLRGDRITIVPSAQDATATGLKILISGTI